MSKKKKNAIPILKNVCVGSCQGACMYMCTYVTWKSNLKCQYLGDIHFIFSENNFSIQYILISQLSQICPTSPPIQPYPFLVSFIRKQNR